jgi:phospholipid/cholesterol/gamma-HCH transport system ATP-binding protein
MNTTQTDTIKNASVEPDSNKPVIEIKNLKKSFGKEAVLKDVSLKLFDGENLVVLGKSGSGKSVLIKCIVGLSTPKRIE